MTLYDQSNKPIPGTDTSVVTVPKRLIDDINERTLRMRMVPMSATDARKVQGEVAVLMAKLLMTLGLESGQPDGIPHGTA